MIQLRNTLRSCYCKRIFLDMISLKKGQFSLLNGLFLILQELLELQPLKTSALLHAPLK